MITYKVLGGTTDFSVVIRIVDSTDGTPETGVVFNSAGIDLQYRRELAASVAITEATLAALTTAHADGGFLHIGNGYYRLDLPDAAVAAGVKGCLVHGTVTGMVVIGCYIEIIGYDQTAALATPTNITAGTITTVTNLTNAPTAGDLTATMKASVTTAVPTAAGIADAVLDEDMTAHQTQGTLGQAIGDPVADANTIYKAVVTDAAGANVAADIIAVKAETAAILTDTAEIGAAGAGLTNINLPNQTMDIVGNITGNLSGSVGSVTAGVTLAASAVQAIWDALTSALTTAGSIGKLLVDNINATISSRASQTSVDDLPTNAELTTALGTADDATLAAIAALNNLSAAQVNAEVDTALADIHLDHLLAAAYDPAAKPGAADALLNELVESDAGVARFTANALEQGPGGGSAPTAAEVADAVWDEAMADHLTGGTTGASLNGAGSAGDPWTTPLPGAYGAGTAGKILGDNINATISSRASQTSVDDLPTNAELATSQAAADDATLAAIAALNNLSAAQVNTEVDTALAEINLDHLVKSAVDTDLNTTVHDNSVLGHMFHSSDVGLFDRTGYSLQALTDGNMVVGAFTLGGKAEIQAEASDALNAYDPPTSAELVSEINSVQTDIAALNNLSAAGVRTAVGLVAANLDTQLADLPTNAELTAALASADDAVLAAIAALNNLASGAAMTLTSGERDAIAAALLDLANGIEAGLTLRQAQRLQSAAAAGKISGAATTTVTIRNAVADTKARVTATVDEDGNRTAITTDVT